VIAGGAVVIEAAISGSGAQPNPNIPRTNEENRRRQPALAAAWLLPMTTSRCSSVISSAGA